MDDRLLDVNRHGVLRVPGSLWLALMVLTRHWLWMLFTLVSARQGGESLVFLREGMPWWPMAAQLPTVFLILAGGHRVPTAGSILRNVWHHGHLFMTLTALLNLCWTGWTLSHSESWEPRPEMLMVSFSFLDFVIAWALWSSRYLRQVFAEFPASSLPVSK